MKIRSAAEKKASQWFLGAAWILISIIIGFSLGWFIKAQADHITPPIALRLGGYTFIDPLLACNINNSNAYQEDTSLEKTIKAIIDNHKRSGDISKASVYIANFSSGQWSDIYGSEEYYPSSIGKIPIMIAYYELAETSPSVLDKEITYPAGSTDLNQMQDIQPEKAILPGHIYTVEQLIEYMIKYSDNNAANLLYRSIDQNTLNAVYDDLDIPVDQEPNLANLDFITPHEIAMLFRVLRNATYLSRDYSEKALQLLSETSFTQGIVAGTPTSTIISHKMGLVGIAPNDILTEHELHDCGIVYAKKSYLLCIMTRGSASLPTLEGLISQISSAVYDHVQNGN
jgi:beta-lactamase class A